VYSVITLIIVMQLKFDTSILCN